MLAYLFWHWRRPSVGRDPYETALVAFHRTLTENPPVGFVGSLAFRLLDGPPSPALGAESYEDWYFVESTGDLDPLEVAAVSVRHRASHDQVASLVEGGAAGLYRLWAGAPHTSRATHAFWFPKPAGMSYEALRELVEPTFERHGAALWGRKLVLGPAPEFCLIGEGDLAGLPPQLQGSLKRLRSVL